MKRINKSSTKDRILRILLLLFFTCVFSQDKRFTLSVFSDPVATSKDGINLGTSIEYQMTIMYFKASTFFFPNLNGKDYFDFQGTLLGFNLHKDNWRVFLGGKTGFIIRDGNPYPVVGGEAGLEYYFRDFYIGLQTTYDYREDGKVWENNAKEYWRGSGFIKIGIEL